MTVPAPPAGPQHVFSLLAALAFLVAVLALALFPSLVTKP